MLVSVVYDYELVLYLINAFLSVSNDIFLLRNYDVDYYVTAVCNFGSFCFYRISATG